MHPSTTPGAREPVAVAATRALIFCAGSTSTVQARPGTGTESKRLATREAVQSGQIGGHASKTMPYIQQCKQQRSDKPADVLEGLISYDAMHSRSMACSHHHGPDEVSSPLQPAEMRTGRHGYALSALQTYKYNTITRQDQTLYGTLHTTILVPKSLQELLPQHIPGRILPCQPRSAQDRSQKSTNWFRSKRARGRENHHCLLFVCKNPGQITPDPSCRLLLFQTDATAAAASHRRPIRAQRHGV